MFPLFRGMMKVPLDQAFQGISWDSEDMAHKHPQVSPLPPLPPPLGLQDVLSLISDATHPAVTVYLASNQTMRQWAQDPAAFEKWGPFAYLLDHGLLLLPWFEGDIYRAIDFT